MQSATEGNTGAGTTGEEEEAVGRIGTAAGAAEAGFGIAARAVTIASIGLAATRCFGEVR